MKTGRNLIIHGLLVFFLVLFLSGQALSKTPGVTNNEITLGVLTDLTGPASIYGKAAAVGVKTAIKEINEKGGINGRKVKVVIEDHQWNPARSVAAYKYLVDQIGVFMIVTNIGTASNMAVLDFVKEEKIPLIPATWAKAMFDPFKRYVFPTVTSYELQMGVLIDYVMETFKPKSPKVGVIYLEDDYGKAILDGVTTGLKYYNSKIHSKQSFKRADVDFSSQVMNLKRAGCNYMVLGTTLSQAANILKESARIKYQPQVLGAPGPTSKFTIKLAGKFMPASFLGVNCIAGWSEDVPGMVKLRALTKKYHPKVGDKPQIFFNQWCYVNAMVAAEGMKRAGKNLTREGFVNAMETIKDFDSSGILPKISYGPKKREACTTSRVMKVDLQKQDFVSATGWVMPKYLKK